MTHGFHDKCGIRKKPAIGIVVKNFVSHCNQQTLLSLKLNNSGDINLHLCI